MLIKAKAVKLEKPSNTNKAVEKKLDFLVLFNLLFNSLISTLFKYVFFSLFRYLNCSEFGSYTVRSLILIRNIKIDLKQ